MHSQTCLTRRYLLWCYKTTKEDLDWIDRKFTQLAVDRVILKELQRSCKTMAKPLKDAYLEKIADFEQYMGKKQEKGNNEKFLDSKQKHLHPHYVYLKKRLAAIESAIGLFLGPKELKRIRVLYEQEMTRRILEAREHH